MGFLASAELAAFFNTLLVAFRSLRARYPGLRLDAPAAEYRDNFNLRGLKSLPVSW